jgi:hypothetical protein
MTPAEFWLLYDHYQPEPTYGGLTEDQFQMLSQHLDQEVEKWQARN